MKFNFEEVPDFLKNSSSVDDVWYWFNIIRQISRASKEEEKIREYIISLAESQRLDYVVDKVGNLVVRVSGNINSNNIVALQSHLDMVCEKNSDVDFDFDKDSINIYEKDGWVKAQGTTLGADNGIGVAYMLALMMNSDKYDFPDLELVFTIDEEQGLGGAINFKKDILKSDIMLNLDSEEDNFVIIGCAGAISFEFNKSYETFSQSNDIFKLVVKGLKGGHSGVDIHKFVRGNAILHLFNILGDISKNTDLELIQVQSGKADNAIPREAECLFRVKNQNIENLRKNIEKSKEFLEKVYENFDINFLRIENGKSVVQALGKQNSKELIKSILGMHSGVYAQSQDVLGVVETSSNFGVFNLENGKVRGKYMSRSFNDYAQQELYNKIKSYLEVLNFNVIKGVEFGGWKPEPKSEILSKYIDLYKNLFNEEVKILAIHAGLECGILKQKYPSLDVISFGPNIIDAHSPDEKVEIKSVEKIWNILLELLKKV